MRKPKFYTGFVYAFIGIVYIAAIAWNVSIHNFNAVCGYFCALCVLVIAFTWYCDSHRLRDRLSKHEKRRYILVMRGTFDSGFVIADVEIETTLLDSNTIEAAREYFIEEQKKKGVTITQRPIVLNAIRLDG